MKYFIVFIHLEKSPCDVKCESDEECKEVTNGVCPYCYLGTEKCTKGKLLTETPMI